MAPTVSSRGKRSILRICLGMTGFAKVHSVAQSHWEDLDAAAAEEHTGMERIVGTAGGLRLNPTGVLRRKRYHSVEPPVSSFPASGVA